MSTVRKRAHKLPGPGVNRRTKRRVVNIAPMRYLFLLLPLLLRAGPLAAQLSLFAGSSFEHEVTERWGYEFQVEHRQLLPTGRENRLLLQVAANRLITPHLNVTPGVRLTPDYGLGETVLRLFTDLNAAVPLGDTPLALEGRLRTQYERVWTEDGAHPEVALRPRLGLVYAPGEHTDIVAEYEIRYRFDDRDEIVEHRHTLALQQAISTRIAVDFFVRLDREVNQPEPTTSPFVGIYLIYVLPDERRRDWRYRSPFGRSLLW